MRQRFKAFKTAALALLGLVRSIAARQHIEPAAHDDFHHARNRQMPKRRAKSNQVKRNRRRNLLAFESRRRNWQ